MIREVNVDAVSNTKAAGISWCGAFRAPFFVSRYWQANIVNRTMGPKISDRVSKMWRTSNVEKWVGSEYLMNTLKYFTALFLCNSNYQRPLALCLATRWLPRIGACCALLLELADFLRACCHENFRFHNCETLPGAIELTPFRTVRYLMN